MAKVTPRSGILLSFSALASLLFVYTTVKLVRHTPVYRPLECTTVSQEFGEQQMDGMWVNTSGAAVKQCTNRNPYNMRLFQGEPSKVYVKDEAGLHPIGNSFVIDSSFSAGGEGTGGLRLEIAVPFMEAFQLLARDKVQIVTEVNALAEAEMFFLGVSVKIAEASSKVCGFELAMMPEQKAGYSDCADSLDELVIPDVNSTLEVADLITMSPELYKYETRKKNLAFGGLMALSALLSISLLACGLRASGLRHRSSTPGAKDAREVKLEAPVAEQGSSQSEGAGEEFAAGASV